MSCLIANRIETVEFGIKVQVLICYRSYNDSEGVSVTEAYRYLVSNKLTTDRCKSARPGVRTDAPSNGHMCKHEGTLADVGADDTVAGYKTPYQMERTESWRNSARKSAKTSEILHIFPS